MAKTKQKGPETAKSARKQIAKDKERKKRHASESKHAKATKNEKVVPVAQGGKKDKKVKDKSDKKRPVVEVAKAEKKCKKVDTKTKEKQEVTDKEAKKQKKSVDDQKKGANEQNTKEGAVASKEDGVDPSGTTQVQLSLPIPPRRVSFKSPPSTVVSETPSPRKALFPSPDASPALSLDNLQVWKEEASKKGMTLEEYMEDLSRASFDQSVEKHMQALLAEQQQAAEGAHGSSMPAPGTPEAPVASHESVMPLPGASEAASALPGASETALALPETQRAKKENENNEVEKGEDDSDSSSSSAMADSDSCGSDDEDPEDDAEESKSEDDDDEEEVSVDMHALECEVDKMIEPDKAAPMTLEPAPTSKPTESAQGDNAAKVQEAVTQQLALKDEKVSDFAKANSNSTLQTTGFSSTNWDTFSPREFLHCWDKFLPTP